MERSFNKIINPSKLDSEVKASDLSIIFEGLTYSINNAVLMFTRDLTAPEDLILIDIINNHFPSYMTYKIWSLVEDKQPAHTSPADINFDILPLAIKRTYLKGADHIFTYYNNASINLDGSIAYSDPVIKASWTWTHDPVGFPIYAEEKIEWYLENDTIGGDSKIIPHYFDGLHKIRKGKEVRGTLVDNMQIPVSEMIIYNETVRRRTEEADPAYNLTLPEIEIAIGLGRSFLSFYQSEFFSFVEHKDLKLVNDITNDNTHTFLGWVNPYDAPNTIRDFIVGEFS